MEGEAQQAEKTAELLSKADEQESVMQGVEEEDRERVDNDKAMDVVLETGDEERAQEHNHEDTEMMEVVQGNADREEIIEQSEFVQNAVREQEDVEMGGVEAVDDSEKSKGEDDATQITPKSIEGDSIAEKTADEPTSEEEIGASEEARDFGKSEISTGKDGSIRVVPNVGKEETVADLDVEMGGSEALGDLQQSEKSEGEDQTSQVAPKKRSRDELLKQYDMDEDDDSDNEDDEEILAQLDERLSGKKRKKRDKEIDELMKESQRVLRETEISFDESPSPKKKKKSLVNMKLLAELITKIRQRAREQGLNPLPVSQNSCLPAFTYGIVCFYSSDAVLANKLS
jgi:hypothetical protein